MSLNGARRAGHRLPCFSRAVAAAERRQVDDGKAVSIHGGAG